ncbi:hypothetical protein [Flavobacterium sp. FlaQc-48]|uniref:hypothetical protein n=1 Tax=Flavobacterium sp. FlaQc-48 TaxID=3374181 RepID=UPI003756AE51
MATSWRIKIFNQLQIDFPNLNHEDAGAIDSNSPSKIEVRIGDEFIDNHLLGLHQVYDDNGNLLEWDNTLNDFNGTPSYLPDGSYPRAFVTFLN